MPPRLCWALAWVALAGCARPRSAAPASAEQLLAVPTPSRHAPGFPASCKRVGKVALVAVQPLRTLDIEAVAERYRRAFGLEVEVLPAVSEAAVASAFVADRRQHEAGRMMGAMLAALPAAPRAPPRWVIGLTDADLFLDDRAWRFCFSSWRPNTGIVSTARTGDGDTDTLTTAVRTSKLLTRLLAETYCGLLRGGPDDSVLRPTLMGVDDLDLIDESVWLEGPVSM